MGMTLDITQGYTTISPSSSTAPPPIDAMPSPPGTHDGRIVAITHPSSSVPICVGSSSRLTKTRAK